MRMMTIGIAGLAMASVLLFTSGCIVWSAQKDVALKPIYVRPTLDPAMQSKQFENGSVADASSTNQPTSANISRYAKTTPID